MTAKHRIRRSTMGRTVGRAFRWIDDWTVEAFNPIYPHHKRRS
ncbi:hypothetical protein [Umezawaea tangerina]|uniref:Uncharacterized protein n=1 Tax=Umezawaea tangerina TaxID=84725 RepID=A0A2T0SLQ2_9PSEU|nr:hypothetical protein [Umezawaea tangerina]PRY34347.1 hypothetical protein CLV43_117121 [Umezawaea tangerina]